MQYSEMLNMLGQNMFLVFENKPYNTLLISDPLSSSNFKWERLNICSGFHMIHASLVGLVAGQEAIEGDVSP